MLAWAQVVQMTTMLRLFEEDVSTASIKPMAEQFATLLIVASSWSSIISDSVCAIGNVGKAQVTDKVSIIPLDLLERETHLRMYWVSTIRRDSMDRQTNELIPNSLINDSSCSVATSHIHVA